MNDKSQMFIWIIIVIAVSIFFLLKCSIDITTVSIGVIAGFAYNFHKEFDSQTVIKAPSILMTCGILATFVGIAWGLLNFNATNIQESLPHLINGIKAAFWASVYAISCAITIKCRDYFYGHKQTTEVEGSTIDDLAEHLITLQKSIAGNEDSTLISQLKLMRQDSNDRMDKLSTNISEFYEKVADGNSQALIQALEKVIRDFNTQINEQFGENFKQLNDAVGKMLIWQENYKTSIDDMLLQQKEVTKNMSIAVTKYDYVLNQSEKFNEIAQNMSDVIGGINVQRNHMQESLSALALLLDKVGHNIPKLETKIEEMTKQISNSVIESQNSLRNLLTQELTRSSDAFHKNVGEIIEKTKEQIIALDKALEKELTSSLESFGKSMAALSEKFSNDYSPIADKLHKVLQIGRIE